jgi:hypothetical protein
MSKDDPDRDLYERAKMRGLKLPDYDDFKRSLDLGRRLIDLAVEESSSVTNETSDEEKVAITRAAGAKVVELAQGDEEALDYAQSFLTTRMDMSDSRSITAWRIVGWAKEKAKEEL